MKVLSCLIILTLSSSLYEFEYKIFRLISEFNSEAEKLWVFQNIVTVSIFTLFFGLFAEIYSVRF
jgi:hypothetical protein